MMPLTYANVGQVNKIIKVKGKEKIVKFLSGLGFVEGTNVTIVSHTAGNVIVNIKESRIAISQEMANRILVKGE